MKDIDIIAACTDMGVHVNGSDLAPEILINNISILNKNKIKNIKKIFKNNNYKKELEKDNLKKNLLAVNEFNSDLYNSVFETANIDRFPLTLGGDHSIAIASTLASIKKHENLGIIWFDAHGDFNTFETTTSGNIHGLPFAALTNYEKKYLTDFHTGNYFNPKNAVLVGASDIDIPYELQNLKDAGVTIFTAKDIKNKGAKYIYDEAFKIASNGTNGIHVSYDLDVIDPSIAPGVSIPTRDGISLENAYMFLDYIIKNKEKIKSLDLVEFNPTTDIDKKAEKIASHILNELIEKL